MSFEIYLVSENLSFLLEQTKINWFLKLCFIHTYFSIFIMYLYTSLLLISILSGATGVCPNRDKVAAWERNLQGSSCSSGLPRGPNTSPREPRGRETNLQGSFSPRGCPGGRVCPFLLSVLLLLGFLLIFGNIKYSNKASLEMSKPFWRCLWLLWLRTRP